MTKLKLTKGNRNTDLNVAKWLLDLMGLLPSGSSERGKSVDDLISDLLVDGTRVCRNENDKVALKRKIQKSLQGLALDERWGPKLVCRVEGKRGMKVIRVSEGQKTTLKTFWKWNESKNALIIPPPNEHACLALLMIESRLKEELPPPTLDYLQPFFSDARKRIRNLGPGNRYIKWQQKIVNQSPSQFLRASKIDREVHDSVLRALYENCQLRLSYLKPDSSQYKVYEVSPLGVVMRGPVTYLVACKDVDRSDRVGIAGHERMFALHRIRKAEMIDNLKASFPNGVTFDGFLERGGADFVIGGLANGQTICLEAAVSRNVANRLSETQLSDNQKLVLIEGDQYHLTAELPITMQLGWWLLAFGPRIKVLNPPDLRNWIAAEHRNAAKQY